MITVRFALSHTVMWYLLIPIDAALLGAEKREQKSVAPGSLPSGSVPYVRHCRSSAGILKYVLVPIAGRNLVLVAAGLLKA